jgi:hypothetical protein
MEHDRCISRISGNLPDNLKRMLLALDKIDSVTPKTEGLSKAYYYEGRRLLRPTLSI